MIENEIGVKFLSVLNQRMEEISNLTITEQDKQKLVKNLFQRYTTELGDEIKKAKTSDEVNKMFNHFINNILSILETQSSKDSFKSMRRLILNEIHGCKSQIIAVVFTQK